MNAFVQNLSPNPSPKRRGEAVTLTGHDLTPAVHLAPPSPRGRGAGGEVASC